MRDTVVGQTSQPNRVYIGSLDDDWATRWHLTLERSQAYALHRRLGDVLGERTNSDKLQKEVDRLERTIRGLRGALKRRKRVGS